MQFKTKILGINEKNLNFAARRLKQDNLVAVPTETVYGLAGRADSDIAVKKIYKTKKRPFSNPLIIHYKNKEEALQDIIYDKRAIDLANYFWPGPLTIVAKIKTSKLSKFVSSRLNTIAIRVPGNPVFRKVLEKVDFPLAAPSANRYGKITPTNAEDVFDELNKRIEIILDGGNSKLGLESTVIDISCNKTRLLRLGSLDINNLKKIIDFVDIKNNSSVKKSPGLAYKHYQPDKPIRINAKKPLEFEGWIAFGKSPSKFKGPILNLSEKKCLNESAKNFYTFLRKMDKSKVKKIAIQKIPNKGLGIALNDRLKRAAFENNASLDLTPIDKIKEKLPKSIWEDEKEIIEPYLYDERERFRGKSKLLVKPKNTNQVSKLLKLCFKYGISVVPQGGRTGLCGGTIPSLNGKEIIISMEKMNKVRSVNPNCFQISVESGCTLFEIQQKAEEHNRLFPLNMASRDSCTIGGNISTNAGGSSVLKYGMTRDLVIGLEVVLPDGKIINGLKEIKKDNRGYDVKHLFIGAEGTLGIVTAATLKLFPKITNNLTAIVAIKNLENVIDFYSEVANLAQDSLSKFELSSNLGMKLISNHYPEIKLPFKNNYPWYVIFEFTSNNHADLENKLKIILTKTLNTNLIADAIIPKNLKEEKDIWNTRELLNAAQKKEGKSIKHDISLPIKTIPSFLKQAKSKIERIYKNCSILAFGHLADGNLHFNVGLPNNINKKKFEILYKKVNRVVFDLVYKLNGSFSAEHGIGKMKIKELIKYSNKQEIEFKKSLKRLIDKKNIMNPGKIFK